MGEYIEREAALEIGMRFCPDDDGTCSEAGTDLRFMLDELDSIPAADVRPKWISVKKRLPEEWRPVLGLISFIDGDKGQQVLWYCGGSGTWRSVWNADKIESEVTHWMPLPEPPATERNK